MASTASGQVFDRLPDEAVGIEGAKPEKPLGGDGGEKKMSQIGPYLSQKRPKTRRRPLADWRYPPSQPAR